MRPRDTNSLPNSLPAEEIGSDDGIEHAERTPARYPRLLRQYLYFFFFGTSKARIASKLNTKLDVLHIARIAHNELRGRPTYAKEVQKKNY